MAHDEHHDDHAHDVHGHGDGHGDGHGHGAERVWGRVERVAGVGGGGRGRCVVGGVEVSPPATAPPASAATMPTFMPPAKPSLRPASITPISGNAARIAGTERSE